MLDKNINLWYTLACIVGVVSLHVYAGIHHRGLKRMKSIGVLPQRGNHFDRGAEQLSSLEGRAVIYNKTNKSR